MLRKFVILAMALTAISCTVAGSVTMWASAANSTDGQIPVLTKTDFDDVFGSVAVEPATAVTKAEFDRLFAIATASALERAAYIDFDKTFTSLAASRSDNTPPNRERLRNAGWKRILGPS